MKLHHWLFLFLLVALSAWFAMDGARDSGDVGTGLEPIGSEGAGGSGAVVHTEPSGTGEVDSDLSEVLRDPGEVVASRESVGKGIALVCTGTILMPDGKVLPEGAAVVAYGNVWPDGEESIRSSVGPGGEFRVAFAPGTYRGFVKLEAPGWRLSAHGVWRNWFEEPLLLVAVPAEVFAVRLVDGTGGDARELRLDRLHWGRLRDDARKPVRTMGRGIFKDPLRSYEKDRYLAWGSGLAPVLIDPRAPRAGAASDAPIVLRKPARLAGTIDFGKSGAQGSGWLESTQPFRVVHEGELGPLVTYMPCSSGPFEFVVPAGQDLELRVGAKGLQAPWTRVASLASEEHRRGVRLQGTSNGGFQGRIIDADGDPVVGAWVRSLAYLYSFEGGASDPGMGAMHEALTDFEGRFEFRGALRTDSLPLEVSVDGANPGAVPRDEPWSFERISQHFEEVKWVKGGSALTFAPGETILKGRVIDGDGQALTGYRLTLYPRGRVDGGHDPGGIDHVLEVDGSPIHSRGANYGNSTSQRGLYNAHRSYVIEGLDGAFELRIPAGEWDLKVTGEGHAQAVQRGVVVSTVTDLEVVVPESASLKVRLTDDLGVPWANLKLRLRELGKHGQNARFKTAGRSGGWNFWSDADGVAHLKGLTPGEYQLYTLGAHMYSFPKVDVSLKAGETVVIEQRMASFGAIRTESLWQGGGRVVQATLLSNGKKVRRHGSVHTAAGSFFPEVKPGEYTLRFHVEDEVPGIAPLFPEVQVVVRGRSVSRIAITPGSDACFLQGQITLNGQTVEGGSLRFNEPGSKASRKGIAVAADGSFHATLPKSGSYGVAYTASEYGRAVSFTLVDVPPGSGSPIVLAFEVGQILLELGPPSLPEGTDAQASRRSMRVSLSANHNGSLTAFDSTWSGGKATWAQVPPGTYSVLNGGSLRDRHWRVKPGQEVTLGSGAAQVTAQVEWEALFALTGECDLSAWPPSLSKNKILRNRPFLNVWGAADRTQHLLGIELKGGPVMPLKLQGVPKGEVWVTVDTRVQNRYELSTPQGPFEVTEEGLHDLALRFDFPQALEE